MLKVVYGSIYGHSKSYAERFAEQFNTKAISYKAIGQLMDEDSVVYFGALYAGGVKGLSSLKGRPKHFVLVTVGLADPTNNTNVKNIKQSIKLAENKLDFKISQCFHLRGGIDYTQLHLHHKLMMKLLYMKAQKIPKDQQNEETKTMISTYGSKVNFVDLDCLTPLITYVTDHLIAK